jgi:hypothetical protein
MDHLLFKAMQKHLGKSLRVKSVFENIYVNAKPYQQIIFSLILILSDENRYLFNK